MQKTPSFLTFTRSVYNNKYILQLDWSLLSANGDKSINEHMFHLFKHDGTIKHNDTLY